MKKGTKLGALLLLAGSTIAMASCGPNQKLEGTAAAVADANKMTMEQLKAASKAEFEANTGKNFKVVGLTSVLVKVAKTIAADCDWITYGTHKEVINGKEKDVEDANVNVNVNNSYKDYQLLTALNTADKSYFADYALVQDARSFSTYIEDGILHNYVPSDADALGLKAEDRLPLKGIHFNKLFWTNTNFEKVNGFKLHNIWQMTTSAKSSGKADAITKVSFQTPTTEQINMSFLLSAMSEKEQPRIEAAAKKYFGADWKFDSSKYQSAGEQWMYEFLNTISRWHKSDGDTMKQTQLEADWNAGYVYYGAFAKMKDAVDKSYSVDIDGDGKKTNTAATVVCDGRTYTYDETQKVNAMTTVKWDWAIDGFNGFMYCMDSQIINQAKFPYTAALFARYVLEESTYRGGVFNASTPDANGDPANQYGYYYPGTASTQFKYAKGDWTKEQHIEREINEDYDYLKGVKISAVNSILATVAASKGEVIK